MQTPKNSWRGFTLIELLVVIAIIAIFASMIQVPRPRDKAKAKRISCTNNLKQVGFGFRLWANDREGKFPMELSLTNGGAMETLLTGDLVTVFEVMSNELNTPRILYCPANKKGSQATSFGRSPIIKDGYPSIPFASNTNVTYFVGMDARTNTPQAFLIGDDNLQIGSAPAKSGTLSLTTTDDVSWTTTRHEKSVIGNIGMADGLVQGFSSTALKAALKDTGLAINRLAMP